MRTFYCTLILASGLFTTATWGQSAELRHPKLNPDGSFQAKLLTTPGQSYTIEASTNLVNWEPKFCVTNAGSEIAFVDTPTLAGPGYAFYRSTLGTAVVSRLSFRFSAFGGAWVTGWMATPVQVQGYQAVFTRQNDSDYPPLDQVVFTGPSGSGLSNSPSTARNGSEYGVVGILAQSGLWTVSYKGTNFSYSVVDPRVASRLVVPLPMVSYPPNGSVLVSWTYRDAVTGLNLLGPPDFITQVQVRIDDFTSGVLSRDATNYAFYDVFLLRAGSRIIVTYTDTLGNDYSVVFADLPP